MDPQRNVRAPGRWIPTLCLTLVPCAVAAQQRAGAVGLVAHASVGQTRSALHWSVGPSLRTKLSEVAYEEVAAGGIEIGGRAYLVDGRGQRLLAVLEAGFGRIVDGMARDSDYSRDPANAEVSRAIAEVTGFTTISGAAAVGVSGRVTAVPLLDDVGLLFGYEWREQTIRMQHGTQVIPEDAPPGTLEGLDSRYEAGWTGWWAAVEPTVALGRAELTPRLALHFWGRYEAEGTWNLRTDLAQPRSFVQGADAWGYQAALRGRYRLTTDLSVTVQADYGRRVAEDGFDTAFLATGDAVDLVLREAVWHGGGWQVGVSKRF